MEQAELDALLNEAHSALRNGDLDRAEALGEKLLEIRHSSGFEILALAAQDREDLPKALEILKRGLRQAPGVWLLWQLLGNTRSDLGDLAGAREAYTRALGCPGVWVPSIEGNLAILDVREGEIERALARLDNLPPIDDEGLSAHVLDLRLSILRERRDERSADAQYIRLIIEVPTGFYQNLDVVADNPEAALRFIVDDLGPDYVGATVSESEVLQAAPDHPAGVYAVHGGRVYFSADAEE